MKRKLNFKQSIITGFLAGLAAIALNTILFFIFHSTGIITDTIFIQQDQPLTIFPVIISSFIPALIASAVFFLLEKYTKNGFKVFSVIAIILMLVSFLNPFILIQKVTVEYALALNLMHVIVVFLLLFFIRMKIRVVSST